VISVAPNVLTSNQFVNEVVIKTLEISNRGRDGLQRGQLPNSEVQSDHSTLLTQQGYHRLFLPLIALSSNRLVFNLFTDNSPLLSLEEQHAIEGIQYQEFQAVHEIYDDHWYNGGNNAFERFGSPIVGLGGISQSISMQEGEHSYSFNGYPVFVRNDFPEENVYRMIIESEPNAPVRSDISVGMSGEMGIDSGVTFEESFTFAGRSIRYFVHNDYGGNASGAPQVLFLLLPSQAQDLADVSYRHNGNDLSFDVSNITLPATIYMVVSYHDISNIEQWFRDEFEPIVLQDWLRAEPSTGAVGAGDTELVEVTFDGSNLQPANYSTQLVIQSNDAGTPLLSIPVNMTLQPTANMGWVEGTVTDAHTSEPLEATIIAQGQPYTITTDSDTGSYKLWLDAGDYTLQVAASEYATETEVVNITAQQGTTKDLALLLNLPVLEVTEDNLAVTHQFGDVTMQTLTITNEGPAPLTFEIDEVEGHFTPALMRATSSSGGGDAGGDAFGYIFRDSNDSDGPTYAWEEIASTGTPVSGWTSTNDGYAGAIPIGFDFNYYDNSYSDLYVSSNGYVSFGQGYYNSPSGTLPRTNSPNNDIALFGGDMRLVNYGSDTVVYYQTLNNPTRFVLEFVNLYDYYYGDIPHTFQVILYPNGNILSQYQVLNGTSTSYVGLENIDGTDGLSYGAALSDGLAICYVYPGNFPYCNSAIVPWLATDPISGTVPAYSSMPIPATFDATGLQPGNYTADILVKSNDPATAIASVAVSMNVQSTAEMGQVTGLLSDAWTGLPLTGTVELVGVYSTTASSDYNIWAAAGTYSLMIYAPDYYTMTQLVEITAGGITGQDMALERAQARLEYAPSAVTATVVEGETTSQTLVISNTGPVPLQIALHEINPTPSFRSPLADLAGKRILYDLSHGEPGSGELNILIDDLVNAGVEINGNLSPINEAVLTDIDLLWINCCGSTNWTFAELSTVFNWLNSGGAVFVHGQKSPATSGLPSIFEITYQSSNYYIEGTSSDILDHPIAQWVSAIYLNQSNNYLTASSSLSEIVLFDAEYSEPHIIAHQQGAGKMVVVASDDFVDSHIELDDNRLLAHNILTWLAAPSYSDVAWLSLTPSTTSIPSHSSQAITVYFDATMLSVGEHQALLAIEHNDPAFYPIELPVELTVEE
jgi:hypothetical protein